MIRPAARAVLFITHAEVTIDPAIPVTDWPLSEAGRRRHRMFNSAPAAREITAIYSSTERKAQDGAEILAEGRRVTPVAAAALGENDRSATGYLPPASFQTVADLFFAFPRLSILGWERAMDAQARIVTAVRDIMVCDQTGGDVAIVAHGGVGALLLSHLAGAPISRDWDQPGRGGGNYFKFDLASWTLVHGWRAIAAPSAHRD